MHKSIFGLALLGIAAAATAVVVYRERKHGRLRNLGRPKDPDFFLAETVEHVITPSRDDGDERMSSVDPDFDTGL